MKNFIPIVNHSLRYNPSIDGLRGIAISLVLLFHIWPDLFSFGYVGVDIFFALSGYLITQIIYTKLESNTFSLKEFYRNRIRRIFPALIIVIAITLLIGYLFMLPSELEQLGSHIKSSAFFYENFRLIDEVGYWDESAILKPLLHFWSLAIEEQFYIFWPLLLIFLYKIRLSIIISLSLLFVIFFTIPLILDIDKFYHVFSRVWELSLGGLFFIVSCKHKKLFILLNKYKYIVYTLFFLSILFSYNNAEFSILKTFTVVFFSAILLLSLSYEKAKTFFSNKFLVFMGLVSFPLYLWHYVLASYVHIFGLDIKNLGILLILISVFLAYLTYRYIEIYSRAQSSYKFTIILFLLVLSLGVTGHFIYKSKGLPSRSHLAPNHFLKQFTREPPVNSMGVSLVEKVLGYKPMNDYIKSTSNNLSKKYALLIGDSHAHTSYPGLAQELKSKGNYETILLANSSCPPYYSGAMGKNIVDLEQCQEKINNIYALINSKLDIQKVILTTRMSYMYGIGFGIVDGGGKPSQNHYKEFFKNNDSYNQKQNFFDAADKTFLYFENNKKLDFYYLIENPELGFSPKNCLTRPFNFFPHNCKLSLQSYLNRAGEYRNFIYKLSKKYKNIHILDPKDMYCDNQYCYAIKDGKMLYADDDHHSVDGSIKQAKYFISNIVSKKDNYVK